MFGASNLFDRGTPGFDANFDGASNTVKNKTNARATMQMVCIHQEVKGEKLWKSHYNQPLFRLIEPHDLDHQNFLLMRNEIVENAFLRLDSLSSAKALYSQGNGSHLKFGTYPYGRYQTLPQINYSLALAQLEKGVVMSYADVWTRVRPSGICLTSESSQANFDVANGDIRSMLVTGPSKMHNCFGRGIEIGWQFGVLIKPVKIEEGDSFEYRVTIDGKTQKLPVNSCIRPSSNPIAAAHACNAASSDINPAVARGYIWQLEFYCCPDRPELDEYSVVTNAISSAPGGNVLVKMTGGYIRLGKINYEHLETRDFFDSSRKDYTALNSDSVKLSACAVDMDACCLAPILDVFWDTSAQKLA